MSESSHVCPVCGEYKFPEFDSYDVCPTCGWEDDWYQEKNPDEDAGANEMSLNAYKTAYSSGWRPEWLDGDSE